MRAAWSPADTRKSRLLQPFRGDALDPPPLWLMRQAGRYLPEYRELRAKAGSFLDLCYAPELAAEVTLQPIRRYGFDAAILFSDILVVPDALGQQVSFIEGEGPRLEPLRSAADLARLDRRRVGPTFERICETVSRVRSALPAETELIGFCGAPWTVAVYMTVGRGGPEADEAKRMARSEPEAFAALISLLCDVSVDYLSGQVRSGAGVLQIFDSWAGHLAGEADTEAFERWIIEPTAQIVSGVKARHPNVPIIGFPRQAGRHLATYAAATGVDGVSCDTEVPLAAMRDITNADVVAQGNLDPMTLVAGGQALEDSVRAIRETMAGRPFIFNLGHGIVPQTPTEHVARLVALVRASGPT